MDRRFAVHAGPARSLILALVIAPALASAAPKGAKAKADFQRGVKAYQKADYAGASDAFKKSYAAEADSETLFAWAQAERQQDHCVEAIELYRKLDAFKLPDKNREVITAKRQECEALIAADHPAKPDPEPDPEPKHTAKPPVVAKPVEREPDPVVDPPPASLHDEPWWHDPIGDGLAGAGVIGLGLGLGYVVDGYLLRHSDAATSMKYQQNLADADHDGALGVGFGVVGAVLLTAGIVRYELAPRHHAHASTTSLGGWASPTSTGVALTGRF